MEAFLDLLTIPLWLGAAFGVIYTALESPIEPVQSLFKSWKGAFQLLSCDLKTVMLLFGLFCVAPLLEFLFIRVLPLRPPILLAAGLTWQAITAGAIAFIAVGLHQSVLAGTIRRVEPTRQRLIWATIYGVAVFLTLLLCNFGFALLSRLLPRALLPIGNEANWMLRSLMFVPLALIRPAQSLGDERPPSAAFAAVFERPISFIVWITSLSVPMLLAKLVVNSVVRPDDMSPLPYFGGHLALALFSVFNCAAFEMTTMRLLYNLRRRPASYFDYDETEA
jgi:hypothetical protein